MSEPGLNLQPLFDASSAGELRMTKDSAAKCVTACTQYVTQLDALLIRLDDAFDNGGFGTLPSGLALQKKFSGLLTSDPNSLKNVLKQHIEVAQRLREVFEKAGAGYAHTEQDTTRMITQAGSK